MPLDISEMYRLGADEEDTPQEGAPEAPAGFSIGELYGLPSGEEGDGSPVEGEATQQPEFAAPDDRPSILGRLRDELTQQAFGEKTISERMRKGAMPLGLPDPISVAKGTARVAGVISEHIDERRRQAQREGEDLPTGFWFQTEQTGRETVGRVAAGFGKGGASAIEATGGLLRAMGIEEAGQDLVKLAEESRAGAEQLAPSKQLFTRSAEGDLEFNADAWKDPQAWADSMLTTFTSLSTAGAMGGGVPSAIAAAVLEAGPMFNKLKDEGMGHAEALARSIAFGAVVGQLNKWSFGKMFSAKSIPGAIAAGLMEGLSEGLEEPMSVVAEMFARDGITPTERDEAIIQSIGDGLNAAIPAMLSGGGGAFVSAGNARIAERAGEPSAPPAVDPSTTPEFEQDDATLTPPTQTDDRARDSAYINAVERKDEQTQERLISAAAQSAGYTEGWHGRAGRLNAETLPRLLAAAGGRFGRKAFYLSDSEPVAAGFATHRAGLERGVSATRARTYRVFVKLSNPLLVNHNGTEIDDALRSRIAKELTDAHDGVIIRNVIDDARAGAGGPSTVTAVFDPSRVRLSDPVVRDGNGDIIPPSERFADGARDIRGVPTTLPVGEQDGTLTPVEEAGAPAAELPVGLRPFNEIETFEDAETFGRENRNDEEALDEMREAVESGEKAPMETDDVSTIIARQRKADIARRGLEMAGKPIAPSPEAEVIDIAKERAEAKGTSTRQELNEEAKQRGVEATGSNESVAERVVAAKDASDAIEEDLGGETPIDKPRIQEVPLPNQTKTRGVHKRALASPNLPEEWKRALTEDQYVPERIDATREYVDAWIEHNGIEFAERAAFNERNGMKPSMRVATAMRIAEIRLQQAKEFEAEGNKDGEDAARYRGTAMLDFIATFGTEGGQGSAQFRAWSILDGPAALKLAIDKKRAGALKNKKTRKRANKTAKKVSQENKKATPRVLKAKKVKAAKAKAKKAALKNTKQEGGIWDKYRASIAKRVAGKVQRMLEPKARNNPALAEFSNRIAKLAETQLGIPTPKADAMTAAEKVRRMVKEFVSNPSKYSDALESIKAELKERYADKPHLLAEIDSMFEGVWGPPLTAAQAKTTINQALAETEQTIDEIVRKHYFDQRSAGSDLVAKVVANLGIAPSEAKGLVDVIKAEYDAQTAAAKRKIIESAYVKGEPRPTKDKLQKLIEMSNVGAFADADFRARFAEAMNLEAVTAEQAKRIQEMADAVQELPEGHVRNRKASELMSYIHDISGGVTAIEIWTSMWYANVLSGLQTHERNMIDTAGNVLSDVTMNAIVNADSGVVDKAQAVVGALNAMMHGLRKGVDVGVEAVATGDAPFRGGKWEVSSVLDRTEFKGAARFLNKWKYVGRALKGEDAIWFMAASDAKRYILARSIAKDEGAKGDVLRRRIDEILFNTPNKIAEFTAQAEAEGLGKQKRTTSPKSTAEAARWKKEDFRAEQQKRLRVYELMEQSLPEEIVETSREFGARATYNHKPEGVGGVVADAITRVTKDVLPARFIIPFTQVVANVTNRNISYTPMGMINAKAKLEEGTWTKEQYDMQRAKAITGSIAAAMLLAMNKMYEDDDDPPFAIYGRGPSDYKKRNQLKQQHWRPYSVKVGDRYFDYRLSPFALMFAIAGSYSDGKRYDDEEGALLRATYAMLMAGDQTINQSFMSGLSDVLDVFKKADTSPRAAVNKAASMFLRTGSSFVVPNLFKQIDQVLDPTISSSKGIRAALQKQMPFVRRANKPTLNALGEPAVMDTALVFGKRKPDPVWDVAHSKGVWIPEVGHTVTIAGHTLNEDQRYDYAKYSGQMLHDLMENNLSALEQMTPEQLDAWLKDVTNPQKKGSVRYRAKKRVAVENGIVFQKARWVDGLYD